MNKVRPQIHAGSGQGQVGTVWTQVEGGDVESRFSKATYFPLCPQQTRHLAYSHMATQDRLWMGWLHAGSRIKNQLSTSCFKTAILLRTSMIVISLLTCPTTKKLNSRFAKSFALYFEKNSEIISLNSQMHKQLSELYELYECEDNRQGQL